MIRKSLIFGRTSVSPNLNLKARKQGSKVQAEKILSSGGATLVWRRNVSCGAVVKSLGWLLMDTGIYTIYYVHKDVKHVEFEK